MNTPDIIIKMSSQEQFGKNIRMVRTKAELTQQQVADKAKMHVNYYARIERGEENPSFETLEKIIKALGVKSKDVMPF
jgi:transcriptional regulator with XRE-family HTH domain